MTDDNKPKIQHPFKDAKGRFKKGCVSNPKGKPKGKSRVAWFNQYIREKREQIIDKVVQEALKGEEVAMQLVVSRMIPQLAHSDEEIYLDGFTDAKTRTEKACLVSDAVANGVISPGQGAIMMGVIEKHVKIAEAEDVLPRLEELERQIKEKS